MGSHEAIYTAFFKQFKLLYAFHIRAIHDRIVTESSHDHCAFLFSCCAGERLRQTSTVLGANGRNDKAVSDEPEKVAGGDFQALYTSNYYVSMK